MVTVAIIGILAAVGYPSYLQHIAKGRRADAKSVVLQASQWMERFYAENYRYDQNTASPAVAVTDPTLFAGRFKQSPASGDAAYNISLKSLTANTYTVAAVRTGAMANDKCGDLEITHLGVKKIENWGSSYADEAAAVADCWK
jgi:type IV pilus assembly protein PilE